MKLYKTVGAGVTRFSGSEAAATADRQSIFDAVKSGALPQVKKRDILSEPIEVPTDKPSLITYLNSLVTK